MAQLGNVFYAHTNPLTDFTGALATNAGASLDLLLPGAIGAGKTCRSRVKSVAIESVQNLAWEIWLFGNNKFRTGDLTTERVIGRWGFIAADGLQIGGTGLYSYYIDGNDIPYEDLDNAGQLHLMLVNRDAVAKVAGVAGALRIDLGMEPTLGW